MSVTSELSVAVGVGLIAGLDREGGEVASKEAKARRSKIKDARQAPADDGVCTKTRRKHTDKPWEVVKKNGLFAGSVFHRAATREQAEVWAEKTARSYASGTAQFEIRLRSNAELSGERSEST